MKTIGLLGGMSWESTVGYYQIVNQVVKEQLGGLHSAKCVLYSVDFQEIEECQARGEWEKSGQILAAAAQNLECAGADFLVICTNTMHKIADQIQVKIKIPILHIAELTAQELLRQKIHTVGLLGTRYTMEQEFYKQKLIERGITVLIPDKDGRNTVNDIIYQELCLGIIKPESKRTYVIIAEQLAAKGAEGIILGCTEIGMLLKQEDTFTPLFDTTLIHATGAARFALE